MVICEHDCKSRERQTPVEGCLEAGLLCKADEVGGYYDCIKEQVAKTSGFSLVPEHQQVKNQEVKCEAQHEKAN